MYLQLRGFLGHGTIRAKSRGVPDKPKWVVTLTNCLATSSVPYSFSPVVPAQSWEFVLLLVIHGKSKETSLVMPFLGPTQPSEIFS